MDNSAVKLNTLPEGWDKYSDELRDVFTYMSSSMSQELPVVSIDIYYFILAIMMHRKNDAYMIIDKVLTSSAIEDIYNAYYMEVKGNTLIAVKPNRKCLLSSDLNEALKLNYTLNEKSEVITSAHILLTILGNSDKISDEKIKKVKKVFEQAGLFYDMAKEAMNRDYNETSGTLTDENIGYVTDINVVTKTKGLLHKKDNDILSQYCTNLNDAVKKGKIFDVIGRNNEKKEI